jgi:hypothetical protein
MQYANEQEYEISNFQENIEFVLYALVCFLVPFFFSKSQIFTGIVVNAALVLAALNLKGLKLLPIILMPSIGVLAAGVIFGALTPALLYMIPFIWVANAVIVIAVKELFLKRKINRFATLGIGAGAKTLLLFGAAFALFSFGTVPALFLTTMGVMQLMTAISGGMIALGVHEAKKQIV